MAQPNFGFVVPLLVWTVAACATHDASDVMPDAGGIGDAVVADAIPSTGEDANLPSSLILDLPGTTFVTDSYRIPVRATQAATFDTAVITLCFDPDVLDVLGARAGDYAVPAISGYIGRLGEACTDAYITYFDPIDYVVGTALMTVKVSALPTPASIGLSGTAGFLGYGFGPSTLEVEVIAP
jgi:hypothetical protein